MSCGVTLNSYESWDCGGFYREQHVKHARKAHRCTECQKPIVQGDAYVRVSGKNEDDVWSHAVCEPCMALLKEFSDDGSWCFGEMWDTFRCEWHSGASLQGCMNRVSTVAAKAKLRDEWLAWKGITRESQEAPHTPQDQ